MGCWNETCVLTRTPIHAGDPVVVLTAVNGPSYRNGDQKTSLLFGLPLYGQYDDYGGIELEHPELQALNDEAFLRTGLYREVASKRAYGSGLYRFVASSAKTLWGHEHDLKHLYYASCGVKASEVDSYDRGAQEKTKQAYTLCQAALVKLGDSLKAAEFPEDEPGVQDALHQLMVDAFGPEQAWAAQQYLRRNGLFCSKSLIFMHATAYRTMVETMGARLVGYYRDSRRIPVRDFLKERLFEWLAEYEESLRKTQELARSLPPDLAKSLGDRDLLAKTDGHLKPLTSPWLTSELPIRGHYWDADEVSTLLAAGGEEAWLDYFVFQWARHYVRFALTPMGGGSQNEETLLLHGINKAVFDELSAKRGLRKDFDGVVHR